MTYREPNIFRMIRPHTDRWAKNRSLEERQRDYERHITSANILHSELIELSNRFKKSIKPGQDWTPEQREMKRQIEMKQKAFDEEADFARQAKEGGYK